MSARPIATQITVSSQRTSSAAAFCAVVLGLLLLGPARANGQSVGATLATNPRATLVSSLATPVGAIVRLRAVGAPVPLGDGRIAQTFQAVSNARFELIAHEANPSDVTWTDGADERPLSSFSGAAGVHGEIRVIFRGESPARLSARAVPAQSASLGSGDTK